MLSLGACSRSSQNKDAVRQGVMDYLSGRSDLNVASMDVNVTSVQFNGDKAEATVSFAPKSAPASQGMTMRYQLEQKGSNWVVVGKQDSGHSGSVPPGSPNPHGAGAAPSSPIPSPEDLPPANGGKK